MEKPTKWIQPLEKCKIVLAFFRTGQYTCYMLIFCCRTRGTNIISGWNVSQNFKGGKEMKKKIFVKAQIHGTYIVGEDDSGMYLIDQHAAQERINYEYFLEKYSHPDMTMRDLLIPITVEYPLSECMMIEERKDLLKEVGIDLEPFGNGFIIKQLPMWMNQINEHLFIEDMIQQILKDNKIDLLSLQEHAIATLSCKASLKGNSHLSIESMQTIVDNLMRCDNPYVCPHGRPTIIHYSAYELEKLFKRVV